MNHYITINKKYHNESTALQWSEMNNGDRGGAVVGVGGGVVAGLKLALLDSSCGPQLPKW